MLLTGVVALIVVLALGLGLGELLVLMGVTATAILQLSFVRSRSKLIYVGFFAGLAALVITAGVTLVDNQPIGMTLLTERRPKRALDTGRRVPDDRAAALHRTPVRRVDRHQPAGTGRRGTPRSCRELVRRAPSTYNHSITVGSIAEAAAESIGARGLLVRVGSYFHDIGKMLKPGYFIENQGDEANRHEDLVPAMSTLVIIAHIKDGANLAGNTTCRSRSSISSSSITAPRWSSSSTNGPTNSRA